MATNYNPKIVTDGLVLCLDAANTKSYPGSGTTWTDISGKSNNGTLTNGPTFDSGNQGSFGFDGSNDYVSISNAALSKNCSILLWFKGNPTPNNWSDVFTFQTGVDSTASRLEKHGNTAYQYNWYMGGFVSGTVLFNHTGTKYDFISLVFDDTNATCYQNAVQTAQTASSDFGSASVIHFGKRLNMNALWSGNIAQVSIYHRPLTATEVLQNYNATKGRFGL